jgi:hypothetical protein
MVLGKRAEEIGYRGVWVPETTGLDGVSLLAALAIQTSRLCLGSGLRLLVAAGVDRVLLMPVTVSREGEAACLHTIEILAPNVSAS